MKNFLKFLAVYLICKYWLVRRFLGFSSGVQSKVVFIGERADWAIKTVGTSIVREINNNRKDFAALSLSPASCFEQIVHFGSHYMWLKWYKYLSASNTYVVSFFHGDYGGGEDHYINEFLKSIPYLDKVITSSTICENRLLDWGIPKNKVVRIPIGVDTGLFKPQLEKREVVRRKFKLPEDVFVVGSFQKDGVGWDDGLIPKMIKGPDIFIEALDALKQKGIKVHAFLCGPARGYVARNLQEKGIPYTRFFSSSREELADCYFALDAYLITSREEGGPMGLTEAMASGIPVVSTRVGMANDLISEGINGFLAPIEDVNCLSEKLIKLIDVDERLKISYAGRDTAVSVDESIVALRHLNEVYLKTGKL